MREKQTEAQRIAKRKLDSAKSNKRNNTKASRGDRTEEYKKSNVVRNEKRRLLYKQINAELAARHLKCTVSDINLAVEQCAFGLEQ